MAQVEEKRLVAALVHKLDRRLSDLIVRVANALWLLVTEWREFFLAERILRIFRCGKALGAVRHTSVRATLLIHHLESITRGIEPDMPFPRMPGAVAVRRHRIR